METLLAILLYMQVITAPNTYQQSYIDMLETKYQVEINEIKSDPEQMYEVDMIYRPRVREIIIIDEQQTLNAKVLRDFARKKVTDCSEIMI